ncbi:MAG: hypothetical protein ACRDHW_13275 [Ktedonobacteraceae bacterium]
MQNPGQMLLYRLGQVRQQLGYVVPLSAGELAEVATLLPAPALRLFVSMSAADQRHSLRVCQGLQGRGWHNPEILIAALLHDVGKAAGHVPFWTRPAIVLGKRCMPRLLTCLTVYPIEQQRLPRWRRALSYAWWHAEVGADLAGSAGLSERAVYYIRMHHRPDSPELAELHLVDEVS